MSGTEAAFVFGLISGVISICEATKAIYEAAKDAKGQPEAFRQVHVQLGLVIAILDRTKDKAEKVDETSQEALEPILESCKAKAENLKKIFQKVIRKDDDKWYDRYKKVIGTLGKDQKVESLMAGILTDIQVLACEKLTGVATEGQVKEIEEAIKEMPEMPASLQIETGGAALQSHGGSGNNNANTSGGSQHNGTGNINRNDIHGNAYFAQTINSTFNNFDESDGQSCLKDLRTTDPREDKKRIQESKGGLLQDSCRWIFEHIDYRKWHDNEEGRVLWIRGDPGKGKTMLLCSIIDEMSPSTKLEDKDATTLLSFFFCQATDSRINNATAVLRGLMYVLIDQKRSLLSHVRKSYDDAGKSLFEDANAWVALCGIFTRILQDPSLGSTCLMIDALDECKEGLTKLLDFIVQTSAIAPGIKWVISSRNWPDIEEQLQASRQRVTLSLELNSESISAAVNTYIDHRANQLADKKSYGTRTREAVIQHLVSNANDTFLWVSLVCQNLEAVKRWNVLSKLKDFPSGLDSLYLQMVRQINISDDAELCKQILAITLTVYRPLTLAEISSLFEDPQDLPDDPESLAEVIRLCGSLLTLRESTIYFVHQSAKEFLLEKVFDHIFPFGQNRIHYNLFKRSLQVMSNTLRRDVYSLKHPGVFIEEVKQLDKDPLAVARYSCIHWGDHLMGSDVKENEIIDIKDGGLVCRFLGTSYLYWLEALSLIKRLTDGIATIIKLENWLEPVNLKKPHESPELHAFIHDARRFALFNRPLIEKAPLQLYCSALIFTPERSIVRKTFTDSVLNWIQIKPRMQQDWNAALQTLEGHSRSVNTVAFSPDGKSVASGSRDSTVRLWDVATGAALRTLEGHSRSVAFSPDGKSVTSGSSDSTVRLWDAATGAALQTLEGHSDWVNTVAFSPDGKSVASGSSDSTVRLWDAATGAALQTLEGHSRSVNTVAFSPDGKSVASGSWDSTVRLWDAATGAALQTLEGHSHWINRVASTSVVQGEWILEKGEKLLWLPPEYRSAEMSIHNSLLCLGLRSGRVIIIGFEYDLL